MNRLIVSILGIAVALTIATGVFGVAFCRVYVPANKCLILIRKTGTPLPVGQIIAGPGQKGIQRDPLGPGRYFLNPWVWDTELHDMVKVDVGDPKTWTENFEGATDIDNPKIEGKWPEVGILVDKAGKSAPTGVEVVDEGFQGIQKHVLTPGVYAINPHVYEVRKEPATIVPLGFCGVVVSQLGELPGVETVQEMVIGPDGKPLAGHSKTVQKLAEPGQRGVLREVLQPGVYYLNPYVQKVKIVQVGYNQISQIKGDDVNTHITFPSKDGFTIDIEVTVVWGRQPSTTAEMINRFGDLAKLKQIILSQMRSICRNIGSDYESTDFIRGESRERYQGQVTDTLRQACKQRDIEILIALIHNIEVKGSEQALREGMDLKTTIQRGFIAREQELTRAVMRDTAKVKADLETAKVKVDVARETIAAETRKKTAEIKAEGQKKAMETDAARDLAVAQIEREIAELDGSMTRVSGGAKAQVEQLRNQAEADGKRMMVEAFGSGHAYNLYTFAEKFEPESIRLIFSGPGTFWTDLSKMQDAASLEVLKQAQPKHESGKP